jgi:hypothetical protein
MRVFLTCLVATADAIFRDGWTDLHCLCGVEGVHLSDCPLDEREGFEGPVTLCVEVPDDIFEKYEWIEEAAEGREHVPGDPMRGLGCQPGSYRYAVIPAAVLNTVGQPQVWDHDYAGSSRKELMDAIRLWERDSDKRHAQEMRDALEYFDRIGWQTPLRLREEQTNLPP